MRGLGFITLNVLHFGLQLSCLKISVACPAAWTSRFDIEDSTSGDGGGGGRVLGILLDVVVF